jgi:hypothetical protein
MGQLRPFPGFVGPSYTSQSKIACDDRVVNLIPAKIESGTGPATYVYDPAPGYAAFADTGVDVGRGGFSLNGVAYAVFGDSLFQLPIVDGGTPTLLASGLNNPDDSPVTIAGNGDGGHQLMITSGSALYVYDVLAQTLTLIPGIQATFVIFSDGYFLALDPNRSEFRLSALEDGSSWDPIDVVQRNDNADKWIALCPPVHKEIWLFGSLTTSVYYDSGDAATPFVPNPSVSIPRGIHAPNAVGLLNGSPIWLADDLTVRYAQGYTPERVSTHAVEFAIAQYATSLDAEAMTYTEQGHEIYVLNFPAAQASWAYDRTSGLWHERGVWTGLDFAVMDVRACMQAQSLNLVLSRTGSGVFEMSQAFFTETDGVTGLRRVRRAPHLLTTQNRIRYAHLRLLMETGIGLPVGQGSDPQVMLRWSDDGGQTFGAETRASAGPVGAYGILVDWWQLGQGRDRVFEVSTSDPWPVRIVTAFLDVSEGPS